MGLLLATSSVANSAPHTTRDETDKATLFVNEIVSNLTAASLETPGTCSQASSLVVNTGYAKYRGYFDATTGLNQWKGIRYSKAPTGSRRWQAPSFPNMDLSAPITDANTPGAGCPQHLPSVPGTFPIPGGDEDCLFLNVQAPAEASNLPVIVWIHGGGYGYGDASQDLSLLINENSKSFIGVSIQYRLGAFGFLSSQEVKDNGVVNAGILDQALALAWVKLHICKFGGDPTKITIAGQSAGGGSVMYHDIALNGGLGSLLFDKSIAQSPYLPFQPNFNAAMPTDKYYQFSVAAGCPASGSVLSCLKSKPSADLQTASWMVTAASTYGYWGFWPVTDGVYIKGLPSQLLNSKSVNGRAILTGYNAHEGPLFVPTDPEIVTVSDLTAWLHLEFPNLSTWQINDILGQNPNSALTDPSLPKFETDGLNTGGFNALNTGPQSNGQQQRANNIYAEATFACPAYWLAEAYSGSGPSKSSYLYQYSVPYAMHGNELTPLFGNPTAPDVTADFNRAIRKIWGNFVLSGNPSITKEVANGAASSNPAAAHPLEAWPVFSGMNSLLLNLNVTESGLNQLELRNANIWESGRGARCGFYKGLGPSIPA
ncbi:putative lipase [Podospora fimiseda]|uniref:Carboxylic ester hydrolase n=1 Tax=Podospora fimiseda TaxID=252190 RepID=A0AAN7H836_9PEZI|nr:putative lipase [Podospora fimiseda]